MVSACLGLYTVSFLGAEVPPPPGLKGCVEEKIGLGALASFVNVLSLSLGPSHYKISILMFWDKLPAGVRPKLGCH